MRVAAMFSKDPDLKALYDNKLDFHSASAKAAFGIVKDLTKDKEEMLLKGYIENTEAYRIELLRRELQHIKKENGTERTRAKSVSFGRQACRSKTRSIAGKALPGSTVRAISSQRRERSCQMVQRLIG